MTGSRHSSVSKSGANASRGESGALFSGSIQQDMANTGKTRSPRGKASHAPGYSNSGQSRKMQVTAGPQSVGRSTAGKVGQNSVHTKAQSMQLQQQQAMNAVQMQQLQARQQAAQNGRSNSTRSLPIGGNTNPGHMQAPAVQSLKRSRSSSMNSREPESKRSKAGSGGVSKAQQNQGTTHRSIPQSPTSSRSRSRKPTAKASAYADQEGANSAANSARPNSGISGTTTATFNVGSRQRMQNGKARQNQARARVVAQSNLMITVDGIPLRSNVKVTNLAARKFGHELQCMMHAFGESRACSRDTLELVEDSVRNTLRRILGQAIEFAEKDTSRHYVESESSSSQKPVLLEARHVARIIRRDARAMYRLTQSLKQVVEHGSEQDSKEVKQCLRELPKADLTPWELIAELASLPEDTEREAERQASLDRSAMNDPSRLCTWRAYHVFRVHHNVMNVMHFNDYVKCRSTNLVTGISRNPAFNFKEHRRLLLFQKWLDLSPKENVKISIPAWYALGHIAWEAVGLLTQTALVQKYFDELKSGFGDPRSVGWSVARHTLAALGHGIATAIMVPMSDSQLIYLRQEVEQLPLLTTSGPERWRGVSRGSKCLQPQHIKEALRRKDDASGSAILNFLRGCF